LLLNVGVTDEQHSMVGGVNVGRLSSSSPQPATRYLCPRQCSGLHPCASMYQVEWPSTADHLISAFLAVICY
jgi:hypothetical protein